MRKREFIKTVEALSKDYTVCQESFDVLPGILDNGAYAQLIVYYKRKQVVMLNDDWQFSFSNNRPSQEFEKLPFSHKLWMLCAEYAMTPVSKRKDEIKFSFKILPTRYGYLNQILDFQNPHCIVTSNNRNAVDGRRNVFTKSEWRRLQAKYSEFLPEFDKDDPRFEIVEDDDE